MPAHIAYEYRVVPAPKRGIKTKTARTTEDRFAAALEASLNEQGTDGWEFVRSDTLPSEERQGLTGRITVYHTVLIYRREVAGDAVDDLSPRRMIAAPVFAAPAVNAPVTQVPAIAPPAAGTMPHADQARLAVPMAEQAMIAPRTPLPGVHSHDAPQQVPPLGAAGPRSAGQ